jgi:hypothetical protein
MDEELKTKLSTVAQPGLPMSMKLGLAGVAVLAVIAGYLVFRPAPKPVVATTTTSAPPPPPAPPQLDVELRELNVRVDGPVNLEQFGAAIDLLRNARHKHSEREWVRPIDDRIRSLTTEAENRYEELKPKAVAARTRGAAAEVDKIKQRVAAWAVPELIERLDRDLAAVRVAAPLPSQGLRLIPSSPDGGRVQRRIGVMKDGGVEAIPFGPVRQVGFEGDLFQAPSDGEVQLTFVTDAAQSIEVRLRIVGDRGQNVSCDYTIRNPAVGSPVKATVSFRSLGLPAGSIVKQLHVSGKESKVAFRVTELLIVKKRD